MVKRCLIVSYYFPPVGGGGVQRMVKLIHYLSKFNWKFTILTSENDLASLPVDETFLSEIDNLVKIIRIPANINKRRSNSLLKNIFAGKSGYLQRWISALFYIPDIRKNWLNPLLPVLYDELNKNKYDCLLTTSPPYSLAILASQLTGELSIPVILDMRDPWSNNPYKIHPTPYHKFRDKQIELKSIANIQYGVSAYKSLIRFYKAQINNFDPERWVFVPNGYDENDFTDLKAESLNNGRFNIAFSGTFYSHINNPKSLFKTLSQLNKNYKDKILFHHIGSSQIRLDKLIAKYKLENNVKIWGYLSHRSCLDKLNQMDAFCFILDDRNKNSKNTIGGKVYEYLRLKKPILALTPKDGDAAELIIETDSGEVVSPHDTQKIIQILKTWMDGNINYSFKGIELFSREKQARQFLDLLNRACEVGKINN